jgi:hypothetical protein
VEVNCGDKHTSLPRHGIIYDRKKIIAQVLGWLHEVPTNIEEQSSAEIQRWYFKKFSCELLKTILRVEWFIVTWLVLLKFIGFKVGHLYRNSDRQFFAMS